MGTDLGSQLDSDQPYVCAVSDLVELTNKIAFEPVLWTRVGRFERFLARETQACLLKMGYRHSAQT